MGLHMAHQILPGEAFDIGHRADHRHRDEEEQHPRHYLAHLLLWALLPTLCLFIGTTWVGWSLAENETVRLSFNSALQLCLLMYLSMLAGTAVMGGFIRWMSRSFEARPTLNQCIGFAAYVATPFFLSGITALYPSRWLAVPADPVRERVEVLLKLFHGWEVGPAVMIDLYRFSYKR